MTHSESPDGQAEKIETSNLAKNNRFHTFITTRINSFRYAFEGCSYVLRTQRNSWIHGVATITVLGVAACLNLPLDEWAILFIVIGMVWTAEFINTALETLVNLASPEYHPLAKIAKDTSAGAVLITAMISIIVGFLILGPPLWSRISDYFNR